MDAQIDHGSTSSIGHCHPLARTRKKDILSVLKRDVLKKDAFYKQFISKVNVMPKPLICSTKPRSQADIFWNLIHVSICVKRVSSLSQKQQDLHRLDPRKALPTALNLGESAKSTLPIRSTNRPLPEKQW
jgi:hypothetical protein